MDLPVIAQENVVVILRNDGGPDLVADHDIIQPAPVQIAVEINRKPAALPFETPYDVVIVSRAQRDLENARRLCIDNEARPVDAQLYRAAVKGNKLIRRVRRRFGRKLFLSRKDLRAWAQTHCHYSGHQCRT